MADVKLVIKVPEELYKAYKDRTPMLGDAGMDMIAQAIANGIQLPKGHGTLKDADELYSIFKEKCDAYNIDNLSFISDMDMNFDLAPTIIEADKESEEPRQTIKLSEVSI